MAEITKGEELLEKKLGPEFIKNSGVDQDSSIKTVTSGASDINT